MVPETAFEAERPQLTAIAFRLLGSLHDAEDAVQNTWLKAARADPGEVRNLAAWLTNIVTRVCLDQLRAQHRRREEPLLADTIIAEAPEADEHYLRRERVSRALMVVLEQLTPPQRVAYVLHDLFGMPFQQIADILDTNSGNAKKHASRARRKIEHTTSRERTVALSIDSTVVEAFLAAAAGGDIERMLSLMAPNCVRTADPILLRSDTSSIVSGALSVAEETSSFADRIRASTPMLVDGRPAHVIAPGGHLLAVIDISARNGRVTRIDITRAAAHTVFRLPPSHDPQQR